MKHIQEQSTSSHTQLIFTAPATRDFGVDLDCHVHVRRILSRRARAVEIAACILQDGGATKVTVRVNVLVWLKLSATVSETQ